MLQALASTGAMAAFGDHMKPIVSGIIDNFIATSHAQGKPSPRAFVTFLIRGGIPHQLFTAPLVPLAKDDSKFIPAPQTFNYIESVSRTGDGGLPKYTTSYRSIPISFGGRTLQFPYIFANQVPKAGGGTRPLKDLAEHMVSLRGLKYISASHNEAIDYYFPVRGGATITGASADSSDAYFPYLSTGPDHYRSVNGTAKTGVVRGDRSVETLLTPFAAPRNSKFNYRAVSSVDNAITDALTLLANSSGSGLTQSKAVDENRKKAESLLRAGLGDLEAEYQGYLTKYRDLVKRVEDDKNGLVGLTDRGPLPGLPNLPITRNRDVEKFIGYNSDESELAINFLRGGTKYMLHGADIRDNIKDSKIGGLTLSDNFAFAELAIKHKFTTTLVLPVVGNGMLDNIKINNAYEPKNVTRSFSGGKTTFSISSANVTASAVDSVPCDSHSSGPLIKTIGFSLMFKAFGACMLELQDSLKAHNFKDGKNAWNETIVAVGSEFGRASSQSSDVHSPESSCVALFGGVLSMNVLGDIKNHYNPNKSSGRELKRWPGTFGEGAFQTADNPELKGRRLLSGHAASTIAALCRFESPSPNNKSLINVDESTQSVTFNLPTGTIVDNGDGNAG